MKKQIGICWLLLICFQSIYATDKLNLRFTHITNDNGLTQNNVTCIMQDHKGMMWFGTGHGLCRYDGYEIQTYLHHNGEKNTISHNFIRTIYQDSKRRIWIGTDKGLCRYLPEKDEFIQYEEIELLVNSFAENKVHTLFCGAGPLYKYDEKDDKFLPVKVGDKQQLITRAYVLAVDKDNILWIGGANGLVGYNAGFTEARHVKIMPDGQERTINDNILSLYVDPDNLIWAGKNGNGIFCYDPRTYTTVFYPDDEGIPNGIIRAIARDWRGRMWFGTEKGLSILRNNGSFENIQQDYNDRFALNDNAVYCIKPDTNGNMWVGTFFGGVNVFYKDFEQFRYYSVGYADKQLNGKAVRQIVEENEDLLWIATEDGGLHRLKKSTHTFTQIKHPLLKSHNIHALQIDYDRNLWIGTFFGGITTYNLETGKYKNYSRENSNLPANYIFSLYKDSSNTMWVGTTAGLRYFDKEHNSFEEVDNELLSTNFIYFITEDKQENLWVGLRTKGLVCYNKKQGVVRNWNARLGENHLTDNFITCILEDFSGKIWVGTNSGGLFLYRSQTNDFESLLSNGAFTEQCIYGVVEDNEKNLWITTNNGLFRYNHDRQQLIKYTTQEGLPTNHFNYSSAMKDHKGDIFMGTVQGMISFNPSEVKQRTEFPNIIFTGLTIGDAKITTKSKNSPLTKDIDDTDRIVLKHKQAKFFGVEYAAVSPGHTNNLIYAVQMEGIDPEWQMVQAQRKIIFSSLPAGKYTFRVKASSSGSTWDDSNIRSMDILVKPPFYLSGWAFLIYVILITCTVLGILSFYYKRLEEKNSIRVNELEKKKLKEMNQLKKDFFTHISHEFKTPLTLIIAPVQRIMDQPDLPDTIRRNLDLVLKNSNSLINLVKELIDFNKLEANSLKIKLQKGDPLNFIQEICNRFQVLAYESNIPFRVEIENLAEEVWFDLPIVEKIVNNLLFNAFKYTLQGGNVKLEALIDENEDGELFLKIIVTDTGIGISEENLQKVFEPYFQVKDETTKRGWGIGLSLVKNLVKMHKGEIQLSSEPGKGSCFTVWLNVSAQAFPIENRLELKADQDYLEKYNYSNIVSEEQLQTIYRLEEENEKNKRNELLIVEDNVDMLKFLIDIFSGKYDIKAATNGNEALALIEESLPDLVITDIMMPGMDGTELCRRIKSNIMSSHIPVILLTAKTGTQNIIEGYELGADVYIEKPFNPSSLLLQVKNLLRTRDSNRKEFKKSATLNIGVIARNKHDEKLLNDIKKVVEENIANVEFNVSDVIRTVGISRTMLHVKLKSMLDMSIGDYIRNIRIEKAKELMKEGYTISETAYTTGFADPNYFSKCFKKQVGVTPSDFIKSMITTGISET